MKLTDDEIQALFAAAMQKLLQNKWARYAEGGWQADYDAMLAYAKAQEQTDRTGRWKMVRALTPRQYEMLNLLRPDGMKDWYKNVDFLKYLPKTDEFGFLKHFPLHAVDPKELGMKETTNEEATGTVSGAA